MMNDTHIPCVRVIKTIINASRLFYQTIFIEVPTIFTLHYYLHEDTSFRNNLRFRRLIDFVDVACERKVCLVGDLVRSGVLVVVTAFAVRTPAVEVLLPQAQTLCAKERVRL